MTKKHKITDIKIGQKFNKLTILSYDQFKKGKHHWFCKCDCGKVKSIAGYYVISGHTISCGCMMHTYIKHGATVGRKPTPEYQAYINMISRCENVSDNRYEFYGGRGIKVCKRWRSNFSNFLNDMGHRPTKTKNREYSLDRINVNKGYNPKNCRWANSITQMNNTSRSRFIEFNGESLTIAQWARKLNIPYKTLSSRLYRNKNSMSEVLKSIFL